MKENYKDITSRIACEPRWYDLNGTPRYDEFHPDYCPNIYADQVFLLLIACQSCKEEFEVELHAGVFDKVKHPKKLHYGDPPAHNCVGDTMNCEDLEVLQVWYRPSDTWERKRELEGPIR